MTSPLFARRFRARLLAVGLSAALLTTGLVASLAVPAPASTKPIAVTGTVTWWDNDATVEKVIRNRDLSHEVRTRWAYFGGVKTTGSGMNQKLHSKANLNRALCMFVWSQEWDDYKTGKRDKKPTCVKSLSQKMKNQRDMLKRAKIDPILGLANLAPDPGGPYKHELALLLNNKTLRQDYAKMITKFAKDNGFAGVDLAVESFAFTDDWAFLEKHNLKKGWVSFVKYLSKQLKKKGLRLSATVPAGEYPFLANGSVKVSTGYWFYSWEQIIDSLDRMQIMTYDFAPSQPGPIGGLPWADTVARASVQILGKKNAKKLYIGSPAYGRSWVQNNTAYCKSSSNKGSRSEKSGIGWRQHYQDMKKKGLTTSKLRYDKTIGEWTFTYRDYSGDPKNQAKNEKAKNKNCEHRLVWFGDGRSLGDHYPIVKKYGLGGIVVWNFGELNEEGWTYVREQIKPHVLFSAKKTLQRSTRTKVAATVKLEGYALKNAKVRLQWRNGGKGAWKNIQTKKTNAKGKVNLYYQAKTNGQIRIQVLKKAGSHANTSKTKNVTVRSKVTRKVTTQKPRRGKVFTLKGKVLPAVPGQTIRVQRKSGKTWKILNAKRSVVKTKANGTYTVKVKALSKQKVNEIRIRAHKTTKNSYGYSKVLKVKTA